jgi:GT2 family glycosyltransferase
VGRNVGLRAAEGLIVAFPDDDCWYRPDLIADVVEAFGRNQEIDVLVGRTVDADFTESLGRFPKTRRRITRANIWRAGNSNTIFVRAQPGEGLAFDESLGVGANSIFQSGEETDFLLRLLHRGAAIVYDPSIVVHHDQINLRRQTGAQRARQYAPGLGRVLRVHHFGLDRLAYFSMRPLLRAGLAVLSGDMGLAHYKWTWARGVVRGYLAGNCSTKRFARG